MGIPIDYNNLTLKQFIEVKEIESKHLDKLKMRMALVSYFTGKDSETMPLKSTLLTTGLKVHLFKVDLLLASKIKARTKSAIWIGFKRYKSITDATKLNVNQYTALKELGKTPNTQIHRMAGLLFYQGSGFELKHWDRISNELLKAKVGEVAPVVFFYSNVLERLNQILPSFFLINQLKIEGEIKELMRTTPGLAS